MNIFIDAPSAIIGSMFFGGWVSLLLSTIFVIAVILEIANDKYFTGYVTVGLYMIAMSIFTESNVFAYIWNNKLHTLAIFLSYFVIGAVYSIVKYHNWVRLITIKVRDQKLDFIKYHELSLGVHDELPANLKSLWNTWLIKHLSYSDYYKVKNGIGPGQQADMIANWIAFWPFSAIGLFIADPLQHLVTSIFNYLKSLYGNMYERIISKYINISDITDIQK